MRWRGLEPPRPCGHKALNLARLVGHGTAYTDVDGAEADERAAMAVNDTAAALLAAAAARVGAKVVYPSSDYVFDGTKRTPYLESDVTGPISAYGRTKQAGETSVAISNPRHLIVRTSWLFGIGGRNFVETMLRLGREQPEVMVVADQVGCPTYARHLAVGIVELLDSEDVRDPPPRERGPLLLVRVRAGDLRPGRRRVPRPLGDDRRARPSALRVPPSRFSRPSASRGSSCPDWRDRAARLPARARASRGRGVRLLVAGGAGFIGSNYVRLHLDAHPGDSIRVLDKLTYAGRAENLAGLDSDSRFELIEGDIADA